MSNRIENIKKLIEDKKKKETLEIDKKINLLEIDVDKITKEIPKMIQSEVNKIPKPEQVIKTEIIEVREKPVETTIIQPERIIEKTVEIIEKEYTGPVPLTEDQVRDIAIDIIRKFKGGKSLSYGSGIDEISKLKDTDLTGVPYIDGKYLLGQVGGEGGISDGDKGDITVSTGGTSWTIDNDAVTTSKILNHNVTLEKIQQIGTHKFLGRHTEGDGHVQQLTATDARNILNVEDGAEVNNISDVNATDLTDGGDTTLHHHDSRYYTESETDTLLTGKADLVGGIVPASQLPQAVDEILEYADFASFPATGESNKYYLDLDKNKTYRWSGSTYVPMNEGIALGETSSTAYRGDRGKIAYDHSLDTTTNPHNVTKSQVGLSNVPNVDTSNASNVNSPSLSDSVENILIGHDSSIVALESVASALNETIQDQIGTKVVAGTDISVTYDDTSGNTTIAYTGTGGSSPYNDVDSGGTSLVTTGNLTGNDVEAIATIVTPDITRSGGGGVRMSQGLFLLGPEGTDSQISTLATTSRAVNFPDAEGEIALKQSLSDFDYWNMTYFLNTNVAQGQWLGQATSSGTNTTAIPVASLDGVNNYGVFLRSSTTANGGYVYTTASLVADYFGQASHKFVCVFKPVTSFTGRVYRAGYRDTVTIADAVDGAYFETNSSGQIYGKTSNNSTRSSTPAYTMTINTAYRLEIDVPADASEARFRVFEFGNSTPVLDEILTTNIPQTTARVFGAGFNAHETSTTASDMCIPYQMGMGTIEGYQKATGRT